MINVKNEQGVTFDINVVRFFDYQNNQYLIYHTNEQDENGYLKLYFAKNNNGFFVKIEDENEWNSLKELIKVIIKEIKEEKIISISDLDFNRLNGETIITARIFKLNDSVAGTLGSLKKSFNETEETAHIDEKGLVQEEIKQIEESSPIDNAVSLENNDFNKIEKNEETDFLSPFALNLDAEEEEPKSYEELLNQIKGIKKEIKEDINNDISSNLEHLINKGPEETNDIVNQVQSPNEVETINSKEIILKQEIPAQLDSLEVLLGRGIASDFEMPIKEEPKTIVNIVSEEAKNESLEDKVVLLEKKIVEYETKINKIIEILNK